MRLFISIGFDEKTNDELMGVMDNLKKCSRKGMFYERENLRLNFLLLNQIEDIGDIKKAVEKIKIEPFSVRFTRVDRSRREGGDIYWMMAEMNTVLDGIYSKIKEFADHFKYEYEEKPFKARVQLGSNIIARPNFKLEGFEGLVKNISIVKYVQAKGMDIYKELYCKDIL